MSANFASAAPVPGFVSRHVTVGAGTLHCMIGGTGTPMLLVHGWPETCLEWRKMMPLLAKRFTVIAADMRGMGESSLQASGYDKKTLAQDLHALMQKLGHAKCIVVGHDWGGPVAYSYAAQFRDDVDKLIIIDGNPYGPWTSNKEPFWFYGFQRIPNFAENLLKGREGEYLDWFYRDKVFHVVPGSFDEATIAAYKRAYSRPGRMRAGFELFRSIEQDMADNALLSKTLIDVPVLAVGARHGLGEIVATTMGHIANHVQAVVMEDTGHFIPEERPEELTIMILAFIDGQAVPGVWRP